MAHFCNILLAANRICRKVPCRWLAIHYQIENVVLADDPGYAFCHFSANRVASATGNIAEEDLAVHFAEWPFACTVARARCDGIYGLEIVDLICPDPVPENAQSPVIVEWIMAALAPRAWELCVPYLERIDYHLQIVAPIGLDARVALQGHSKKV
jgi:hypothetical protein